MKKLILFFSLLVSLAHTSCGPAAENRETMHKRAKEFQDSIAKTIKDAMAEAEMTAPANVVKKDSIQQPTK